MLLRTLGSKFETRETEEKEMIVEGYFAVFGSIYNMTDGLQETVDPHAFDETIGDDIRCLTNHKSELVLGRTKAGTLELRIDDVGLFGRVTINPKDGQAVDLYERVKRGDVDQCSFGFDILDEEGYLQRTLDILAVRAGYYLESKVKGAAKIAALMFSDKRDILVKTRDADELIKCISN